MEENNDIKEMVDILIKSKDWRVREAIAKRGYGLDILVNDEDEDVRRAVAKQGYGLDKLINDKDLFVRRAVAKRGYGLDILVNDEDWRVRRAVAKRGYGLDILVNDEDWMVRVAVAEQGYGLDILVNDENPDVRRAVAKQGYGLDILVDDEAWFVREAVALQGYGLDKLINDEDRIIRKAVAYQGYGLDILINDEDIRVRRVAMDKLNSLDDEAVFKNFIKINKINKEDNIMKFKISGGKLGNNVVESGSVNESRIIKTGDEIKSLSGLTVRDDVSITEPLSGLTVKDERPKNKKVEEAIEIDPSLIKKNKPSLTGILRDAIDKLNGGSYQNADKDGKIAINKLIISLINNLVSILNEEADSIPININDMRELVNAFGQSYIKLYSIIEYIINEVGEPDDLPELDIEDTSLSFKKSLLYNIFKDKSFKLVIEDSDDNTVTPVIYYDIPGINKCDNLLFSPIYGDKYDITELAEDYIESQKVKDKEETEEILSKAEELLSSSIVEDVIDDDNKNDNINDVAKFAAEIINIKDVLPERDPQKILVILDEDGEYITVGDGDTLLAIDNIDGRDLDKITIVSKSWFDNITSNSKDTIPVGVVPESKVSFSVNGVDED